MAAEHAADMPAEHAVDLAAVAADSMVEAAVVASTVVAAAMAAAVDTGKFQRWWVRARLLRQPGFLFVRILAFSGSGQ
jgi:hypothetical protein